MSRRLFAGPAALMLVAGIFISSAAAGPDPATYQQCVDKAVQFLSRSQAEDGSFSKQTGSAITSICATALLRSGRTTEDPLVAKALKYVESFVQPDGGIYAPDSQVRNYETCLAVMCLNEANKDGRYNSILAGANRFIRDKQWDGGEGIDKSHLNYGGAGYGGRNNRPDLSNTSFLMDALKSSGAGADDEAVKNALVFVSRCQNLESEHNTSPFAAKVNDGGFYYTVAAGGQSMAQPEAGQPEGGLRSYGSMSYAGLKSMIFAGLNASDPRVKAAVEWTRKNYDLSANPGMGNAGLYYYYHTFAKALDALGQDMFTDDKGVEHDWRRELVDELAKRQQADGSWVNENQRWMEANSTLVTGYALLTLTYCKPAAAK